MPLAPQTQFDHYEIIAPLGKGGMGEVYRARDSRLNREVAIKVLPSDFGQDADRLRRFEQEAHATSALNHPNILTVYDFGSHEGNPYLVMELLEGDELRAQLNNGALPVRKALDYAQQVTNGLAAAHEKGIVHRDLKPENLFVTKDNRVKILDFGLAKLTQLRNADFGMRNEEAETLVQSPDGNPQLTIPGTVMGTVAYMSPEQVRGQDLDHRSDIFSFGIILHEMLSGQRAFRGDSHVEVMNAILKEEPPELSETNAKISPHLEKIVRRCLEKKPERRFQTASDLGFALSTLTTPSSSGKHRTEAVQALDTTAKRSTWRDRIWMMATALAVLLAGSFAWAYFTRNPPNAEARVLKFSINPPEHASFENIANSPDGKWLAFTAATGGKDQLWMRALDTLMAQALSGTEGASHPFWSPDSRFVGFFAGGKLRKIELSGGPVQSLCDAAAPLGGAWNRDGVIIFAHQGRGLSRVSATGGSVAPVTTTNRAVQEITHHSPVFLPDGRHFLYYNLNPHKETRGIYLGVLDGDLKQRLFDADSSAVYAASSQSTEGYLLFAREGHLMAQPFDARQLKLTGEAILLPEQIGSEPVFNRGKFSVSDNGVLVCDPSSNRQSTQLLWVDRAGKPLGSLDVEGGYNNPWLSPDEKQVVTDRWDPQTIAYDLWVKNLVSGAASRLTFDPAIDISPVWSPDGSRIVWASNRKEAYHLYQKAASGAGQEEPLFNVSGLPTDWSRDGHFIIYRHSTSQTKSDVWVLPLDGAKQPFSFLQTEADEGGAQLSPDGRWLAYFSNESGNYEVYVQSFPKGGGKRQISTKGVVGPHWRRDGKELFYYAPDGKLMVVEIKSGASFELGATNALFEFSNGSGNMTVAPYTVSADGQRFLLNARVDKSSSAPLTVVLNWMAEMKK